MQAVIRSIETSSDRDPQSAVGIPVPSYLADRQVCEILFIPYLPHLYSLGSQGLTEREKTYSIEK